MRIRVPDTSTVDIPFTVNQRRNQLWDRGVEEHYEIVVPSQFSSQAKAELAKGDWPFQDEEEQEKTIGFPEDDGGPGVEGPCDFKESRGSRKTPRWKFIPRARRTKRDQKAWMVEAGLQCENLIRSRTEDLEDGLRKVFVMPEDETHERDRARNHRRQAAGVRWNEQNPHPWRRKRAPPVLILCYGNLLAQRCQKAMWGPRLWLL